MRKTRNALIIIAVLGLVALLVGMYILFRSHPFAADRPPGPIETAIARRLVVLSIPASARRQANPNPPESDAWRAASEDFQEHCAFCHGRDGRGQSEVARKMYPPVPDLAEPAIQKMSDGSLFAIIQNGVRWTGMPAFRSEHSARETWKLVSFVRRAPHLTTHGESHPSEGSERSTPPASGSATIVMDGTAFSPFEMTVRTGQTVTWVNNDPFPHTISSEVGHFRSSVLEPGQQWQFTPTKEGRFPYVCTLHPGMNGALIVQNNQRKQEDRK